MSECAKDILVSKRTKINLSLRKLIWFIKIINGSGPKTEPWDTPSILLAQANNYKKSVFNQLNTWSWKTIEFKFLKKINWN